MTPATTVLQLDTAFPRIPGDIGCADTYLAPIDIIAVPGAAVGRIVTSDPASIDIAPFRQAARVAEGDLVTTSCGFLSYWQDTLAKACPKPFLSSALLALDNINQPPEATLICTFDSAKLTPAHLRGHPEYASSIIGLPPGSHLRQVIEGDLAELDAARAERELLATIEANLTDRIRYILLECTNLPPYKRALEHRFGIKTTDILDLIEAARPGTVRPEFLSSL